LLEIGHELGKGRIRALWAIGIRTASSLCDTPAAELYDSIRAFEIANGRSVLQGKRPKAIELIELWQRCAARLSAEREGHKPGPLGWGDST